MESFRTSEQMQTGPVEPLPQPTHTLFLTSLILKGLFGLWDILVAFLFLSTSAITNFVRVLTQHELGEDPSDFLANKIYEALPFFSVDTQLFVGWYFLIHGVTNLILVTSLLRRKLWAYPVYSGVLLFFVCYQVYRFIHTYSLTLLAVTFFDIMVIWLVWKEYALVRHAVRIHQNKNPSSEH